MGDILKLHPLLPGHWALFERFVARCVDFGERAGWPITPEWRQEIWRRWIEAPGLSGYFMTQEADAHLFSWMVADFGIPGIHIFQSEGMNKVAALLDEFFNQCVPVWFEELERILGRPIRFVEFDTLDPIPWERILERHGIGPVRKRALLRIDY